MDTRKVREKVPVRGWRLVRSFAEEVKKVSYLGAAGPFLLLGGQVKSIVGGATVLAIAIVRFMLCQAVAHTLIAAANAGETDNERE